MKNDEIAAELKKVVKQLEALVEIITVQVEHELQKDQDKDDTGDSNQ